MRFVIEGIAREFTSIKAFRQEMSLPPTFGVHLFEPKDYTGLGSIEFAGEAMNDVRAAIMGAVNELSAISEWMYSAPHIADLFREHMVLINTVVGLKEVEIDFAVAGFFDMLQALIYEQIRARAARQSPRSFDALYMEWLQSTVKLSQTAHLYPYADNLVWEIQIITHVYGRFGMVIRTRDGTYYVYDPMLACPAQGYMSALLADVATAIYRVA